MILAAEAARDDALLAAAEAYRVALTAAREDEGAWLVEATDAGQPLRDGRDTR